MIVSSLRKKVYISLRYALSIVFVQNDKPTGGRASKGKMALN